MPIGFLDELQENKVRVLEDLIDSYQTASAANAGEDQIAAIADFLVDEGIGVRQGLLRLWDYHWTKALAGKILDRGEQVPKLWSLLSRGGMSLIRGATVARAIADSSGREVARLSQFEEQATTFPLWIKECMARWEMLERPAPTLDPDRLARARAAYARGDHEDVNDVLSRVEAGGFWAKE